MQIDRGSMLWTKLVFPDLKCTTLKQFTLESCLIYEHALVYFQVKMFPFSGSKNVRAKKGSDIGMFNSKYFIRMNQQARIRM